MRISRHPPTSFVLAVLMATVPAVHAQDRSTPLVGGPGGSPFVARCPPGQVLTGLEMRTGDDIDAVRPLCSKPVINVSREEVRPPDPDYVDSPVPHYRTVDRPGYSDPLATTGWFGGSGGNARRIIARGNVVTGLYVESEGVNTVTVNGVGLADYRTQATADQLDAFEVDQLRQDMRNGFDNAFRAPRNSEASHDDGSLACPLGNDGWNMLAVGIHGRSGEFVDAIGLVCGYPGIAQRPLQLGRVPQSGAPAPPPAVRDGEPTICASARSARTRHSPAAPSLEAQCEAARRALPGLVLGRVQPTAPASPVQALDGEPPICASARSARGRNSPAAPSLERQCAAARASMQGMTGKAVVAGGVGGDVAARPRPAGAPPGPPPAAAPAPVPAAPAPPDPADAPAGPVRAFMPPVFDDGAQLWACASAAEGDANGGACPGADAAAAYCRLRGFSGALEQRDNGEPALAVAPARPGVGVRAPNGDACLADDCAAVSELLCAP